ncbi:tRNA threonylcarbamoyladenosine dehydratase [Clostridium sp. MB40-C1]|uniref:tRNA threonylcarbamoyladenosine dehydratase n=1 Tax=Clostridium sp. MB40-C1 TaxID=3070996 RepID=UPI0027E1B32A|nr:tRNA threonylcarbamoyladenosine dehydratase [Clostridium sp. MB40-C1]WMJ80028.1 tRNA threonylcarbamoyladenosine dehydratase [Clostridium sp. MB40-C1]
MEWLTRTEKIIGRENIEKLIKSKVVIFGIGGVGSFVTEALARSGIQNITLIDKDEVDISNINRQIIATTSSVGRAKVDVMKERILDINPLCSVTTHKVFVTQDNIKDIIGQDTDYVVDAIDTVTSKIALVVWCNENNIRLISSMGTGNKLDPTKFKVSDIYKTNVCPLAKVMRKELKTRGIKKLKVVYSEELPIKISEEYKEQDQRKQSPGSISFVPSSAGLIIAGEVIKDIIFD